MQLMSCMGRNFSLSRSELIRSKLSNCSAHVSGVSDTRRLTFSPTQVTVKVCWMLPRQDKLSAENIGR